MYSNLKVSNEASGLTWQHLRGLGLVSVVTVLAFEPLRWLISTWVQPGYAGLGWLPCVAVGILLVWSVSSPRLNVQDNLGVGFTALGITAALRFASQLLDVNVVGALLLCVDVFGASSLLGVADRRRALSPFWLACLFAFCLPLEPMLQRVFGYGLQQVSAMLACDLLALGYQDLSCLGTRITVNQVDVFVDLPCSGAKMLSTAGAVFAFMCALFRPGARWGAFSIVGFLIAVLVVNALRIAVLAAGLEAEISLGFSVMQPNIHEAIGLGGVLLVAFLMHMLLVRVAVSRQKIDRKLVAPQSPRSRFRVSTRAQALMLFAIVPLALSISAVQPRPLDVTRVLPPLPTPVVVADFLSTEHDLSAQERHYFTTFGGRAKRLSYGPFGLLLVSTKSPLRHLHDPTVCMSANGYEVELVGTNNPIKSTVYRAQHADKGDFFLMVSYVSASGKVALSISEVVWHWLGKPEQWTMVQRIIPAGESLPHGEWDASVRRAFNV